MTLPSNASDLAVAALREGQPDLNVRRGSAVRALLIDAWALMNQPVVTEATALRTRMSIANLSSLTTEDLDELAANLMVSRRAGRAAHGVVRLYFASPTSVSVSKSAVFLSSEGEEFSPPASRDATAAELRLNLEGEQYFLDVEVYALEVGVAGNVLADTVLSVTNGPTGVVRVSNPSTFIGGENEETNEQLAARIPDAIAARSIVNKPGVRTVITEQFPEITRIQETGFGDPEMERDIVTGTGLSVGGEAVGDGDGVHIGGKIDIYIRTPSYLQQVVTLLSAAGDVRPVMVFGRAAVADNEASVTFQEPFLGVVEVQMADPATGVCTGEILVEGTDYTLTYENSGLAFSTQGVALLTLVDTGQYYEAITTGVGKSLQVTYITNPDVERVQDFIDNGNVRHVCASVLAKSMVPVFVDVDLTYYPIPEEELDSEQEFASTSVVEATVVNFINDADNGNGFNIDDLYRALFALPIERVNKPIAVRTTMVDSMGVRTSYPSADDPGTSCTFLAGTIAAGVTESLRLTLPTVNLGHVGVGIGDTLVLGYTEGGVAKTLEREVASVERAQPSDTVLTVIRVSESFPTLAGPVTYKLYRTTVQNIASVPRIGALIPRTIRVLQLPV